jgi:hypothetical protein
MVQNKRLSGEARIERLCLNSRCLLDPFCGSGTVLYEAVEKGIDAIGAEVNPAAWHLATLASFCALPPADKQFVLTRLKKIAADFGFLRITKASESMR